MNRIFLAISTLALSCVGLRASTVTSATLTITNYVALTNATSGQSFSLNGDTRTFTNSVANAATQILVHTNDSASTITLSIAAQAGSYPFTGLQSLTMPSATNITFRMAPDTALTITLSPTNWGRVTYSTQIVGTVQTIVRTPLSAESSETQTNVATQLWQGLDSLSQYRLWSGPTLSNATAVGTFALGGGLGLHGTAKTNSYTLTTNDLYVGVDTRANTNLILTLPSAASASNLLFVLKDEGGAGATNTLKIYPASGDRIDTLLTNLVVSNNFGGVMLRSRGSTNWSILASGGGVTGGIAGSGGGVSLTNSVWVAKNGNNTTGARGDASKAYLTLGAAKTNALSGDTIFVLPGTYDEANLLKNGVNWHFFNGAKVTYTADLAAIFDDSAATGANAAVTSTITGEGEFAANTNGTFGVVNLEDASALTIQAKTMTAGSGNYLAFLSSTASLSISDAEITSTYSTPVAIRNAANVLRLNRCKLTMLDTSNDGAAIYFSLTANTNTVLRDCVLIGDAAAGSPVAIKGASAGTEVRIDGGYTANLGADANVSIVTSEKRWVPPGDIYATAGLHVSNSTSADGWAVEFLHNATGSDSAFGTRVRLQPGDFTGQNSIAFDVANDAFGSGDGAIFDGSATFGIDSGVFYYSTNLTAGESAGISGTAQSSFAVQFGVTSLAAPLVNNQTNIGVSGLAAMVPQVGATNGVFVGLVGQLSGYSYGENAIALQYESAALLLDNRDTGLPLLIGRTNNGTTVFKIGSSGAITFADGTVQSTAAKAGANTYATYAAGTAYSMTTTYTNIAFGTTSPTITISTAGTYLINANVGVKYNGLTYVTAQTAAIKVRRTNNTPADIASATRVVELPVLTTFTGGDVFQVPPVIYTATAGDVLELYGNVSGSPGAGSVNADSAEIVAVRIQ